MVLDKRGDIDETKERLSIKACELCNAEASLYCASDAAFLCFSCDATVHGANFLVARHLRRLICRSCNSLDGKQFSGHRSPPSLLVRPTCRSCSQETDDSVSCCSSSSTLSSPSSARASRTTTTSRRPCLGGRNTPARLLGEREERTRNPRSVNAEGIFENWCKNLGLDGNSITPKASRAMRFCSGPPVLPFRLGLAASFWYGVRSSSPRGMVTWRSLRGLQEVSGVPGKLIVAVELKLENELAVRRRQKQKQRRKKKIVVVRGLDS